MQLTRRKLMACAAPAVVLGLSGCAGQLAQAQQDWNNFVDEVNAIVAQGCNGIIPSFIATANTISAVVTALYPSVGAAIAAGAGAVQAAANAICSAVPTSPPAVASLKKRLLRSSRNLAVVIGTVVINGKPVQVVGYQH